MSETARRRILVVALAGVMACLAALPAAAQATDPGPAVACDPKTDKLLGLITAQYISPGVVDFTNNSAVCSYPVGVASYEILSNNLDQRLYDFIDATIGPKAPGGPPNTLRVTVQIPPCGDFQQDAYVGQHLPAEHSFPNYDGRIFLSQSRLIHQEACMGGPPPPPNTPELDSIALFASGGLGMAGYALARLRARRRPQ